MYDRVRFERNWNEREAIELLAVVVVDLHEIHHSWMLGSTVVATECCCCSWTEDLLLQEGSYRLLVLEEARVQNFLPTRIDSQNHLLLEDEYC